MLLEPFKAAAATGAAVELKLRLLAETIPALRKYAHKRELGEIETDLLLTTDEKDTLRLRRQLRDKALRSDFRVARDNRRNLGPTRRRVR